MNVLRKLNTLTIVIVQKKKKKKKRFEAVTPNGSEFLGDTTILNMPRVLMVGRFGFSFHAPWAYGFIGTGDLSSRITLRLLDLKDYSVSIV
ncbi:hypothetical protein CEXT_353661 [Caerostris extrusa]|uniref:Uncharacterized protein n=1 Tax=Caerostris extrusa TaxID=172846 RepID=A0AAV4QRZ8_CAEEX|nr:hypothetical protein CEXT_353661 [Caerostris extrusa]